MLLCYEEGGGGGGGGVTLKSYSLTCGEFLKMVDGIS